jgi:hypothetical protein
VLVDRATPSSTQHRGAGWGSVGLKSGWREHLGLFAEAGMRRIHRLQGWGEACVCCSGLLHGLGSNFEVLRSGRLCMRRKGAGSGSELALVSSSASVAVKRTSCNNDRSVGAQHHRSECVIYDHATTS